MVLNESVTKLVRGICMAELLEHITMLISPTSKLQKNADFWQAVIPCMVFPNIFNKSHNFKISYICDITLLFGLYSVSDKIILNILSTPHLYMRLLDCQQVPVRVPEENCMLNYMTPRCNYTFTHLWENMPPR